MASKPGDQLKMPVLDREGKRALNSLKNRDKPEPAFLDRGDNKRTPNRWSNGDKPETTVLDE